MPQDFLRRSTQPELMDSEPVSYEEFKDCLHDLETINHCTFAYRPTLQWLDCAFASLPTTTTAITIFDIGSGGGDMLRQIASRFKNHGLKLNLIGIDLNPWSKAAAMAATADTLGITYETTNIFDLPTERQADFIISSLFTHHLTDPELVTFMQWMEQHASRGWFINDLHRHPIAYYFIKPIVKLFRLNRLVIHDAPVSVARAFTRRDWRDLLQTARLTAAITWHFPFRYGVSRLKASQHG